MNSLPVLAILATGGTIAGVADAQAQAGYQAATLRIEDLLAAVPALQQLPARLQASQVLQKDSKDLDAEDWLSIAHAVRQALADPQIAGVVVTHGTDTLEETAWFLYRVLPPSDKPVLLVSSMRPATALSPDGPQNLLDACQAALSGLPGGGAVGPRLRGVLAVAAGALHTAQLVQKMQPFHIPAFGSGEAGPWGWVENGTVRLAGATAGDVAAGDWPAGLHSALLTRPITEVLSVLPAVAWLSSHAHFDSRQVQALQAAGFDGALVAATGNGTLHHALEAALIAAQRAGFSVALTSRCPLGRVVAPAPGAIASPWPIVPLPAAKARLELLMQLWCARLQGRATAIE